jgi:NADH-quinone oxidoreductase subunit E
MKLTTVPEPNITGRKFAKICSLLDQQERDPSRLIPILQSVQQEYRYLPHEVLTYVATALRVPPARVYGVATFYAHFTLQPKGKYWVRLCDGTACHVKDSIPILEAIRRHLHLTGPQKTTPDLLFTVETVACLGACGLAPVVVINEDVHGDMTPEKAVALLSNIQNQESQ